MDSSGLLNRRKKIKYIPVILISILISIIYKKNSGKKLILIGGHGGELYDDNAAELHKYLLSKYPEYNIYWGVKEWKKNYISRINGKKYKLGSIKNYLLYLNADICYFSHSLSSDIAPVIGKFKRTKGPLKVHLSHGIEGLKKNSYVHKIEKNDFYICSSKNEKRIKEEHWGIEHNKLLVTGLPRYDKLFSFKNTESSKTILYMPTWREWIKTEKDFKESKFFEEIKSLLQNDLLKKLLESNNYKMELILHPFMEKYTSYFIESNVLGNCVKILDFGEYNIGEKIINSAILITDYSSVCWDFYYLGKPVIFFQFDQSIYLEERGSYINLNEDLFGDLALNSSEVLLSLKRVLTVKKSFYKHEDLESKYFEYEDDKNCERVVKNTLIKLY